MGYCWRTQKCRNFYLTHAFFAGKRAWRSLRKKPRPWSVEVGTPTIYGRFLHSPCRQEPALLKFSSAMAAMHDYLAKAHEDLAGAESELQQGRTNSCARSAY